MKWMLAPALASLFAATAALAHVEQGTYKGTTADGKPCSMAAGAQYFEKNMPHPLNERIPVTVDGTAYVVGHPPIIDSQTSLVFFNHDLFQGLFPTTTGAKALEIEMVHTAEFEGPRSFTVIENFWREKKKVSYRCNDIKIVK